MLEAAAPIGRLVRAGLNATQIMKNSTRGARCTDVLDGRAWAGLEAAELVADMQVAGLEGDEQHLPVPLAVVRLKEVLH